MCGIAGYFNQRQDVDLLKNMISQLQHRGPDGYGYFADDRTGLAHARLSIIDLESGAQPIHNEDKSVWVTFNGEIYNYKELRSVLEMDGHKFYTNTDTEVIVHLYEMYGPDFVTYLNGQFAIALWDRNQKVGFLFRDRVGIQPLFWTQHFSNNAVFFGSEVKALLVNPDVNLGLDPTQTANSLAFWSTPPGRSVFKRIWEVKPGHLIKISGDDVKEYYYWDHKDSLSTDDLAPTLTDSVNIRLHNSDVPVAAYLSGGIDSSLIAFLAQDAGVKDLRTFSIGFEDKEFDESGYQQEVVNELGVKHTSFTCTKQDIAANFQNVIYHTEKPIFRTAPVPMFLLSQKVKAAGYKVVLTGEGADEVFAGYDIFRENYVRRMMLEQPDAPITKKLIAQLYPWMKDRMSESEEYISKFFGAGVKDVNVPWFSHDPRWRTAGQIRRFFDGLGANTTEAFAMQFPKLETIENPLERAQYLEFQTLFNGYLISSQGDRMLMANGVEGRFPFLDPRVVDLGNTMFPSEKLHVSRGGTMNEKMCVKRMAYGRIPDSVVFRKKQPYMAPDGACFFEDGKALDFVDNFLTRDYGYFDLKRVNILRRKFEQGNAKSFADNMSLVGILSTHILHDTFVTNRQEYDTLPSHKFDVAEIMLDDA